MSAPSGKASDSLTVVSPQDEAFHVARRTFVAGDRVEIGDLANTLGVNRVTVHRWLGNRTQILTDIIWSLAEPTIEVCYREAPGTGGDRIAGAMVDFIRRTYEHKGTRAFLEREHETALRILTRRDHAFQPRLITQVRGLLALEQHSGTLDAGIPLDDLAFLIVRVVESFVYVERIVGEELDLERAERALRFLLR
ncbi:MAG: QsdR family transcriptional regulator [Actinomycetota bacterium]